MSPFVPRLRNPARRASHPRRRSWRLGVLACAVAFATTGAAHIVHRHDVDSDAFERLARDHSGPLVQVRHRDASGLVVSEGTLIADRWVLTAAHAVDDVKPGGTVLHSGATYGIDRIVVHPGWTGVFEELHDLALLRLADAPVGAETARLYREEDEEGVEIVVVGRGMTGTGLTGPTGNDGVLRAATNRVSEVGPLHLAWVFDSPDAPGSTRLEGISGPGDSGGPALLERDGALWIVGVSSAQDSEPTGGEEGRYGVIEYYTRVSAFADWIDATIGGDGADASELRAAVYRMIACVRCADGAGSRADTRWPRRLTAIPTTEERAP